MKTNVEIHYYHWTVTYEILVFVHDPLYVLTLESDFESPRVWGTTLGDGPIKDLSGLSEEEMFQESVVWDNELSIYLIHAIQKYIDDNIASWYGTTYTCKVDLEY